ncbi:MAG: hypothetical protein V4613_10050 [Bacteroidota bacterium]
MNKTIKRELEVAFSKKSQSVKFRVIKYIALAILVYFFWGNKWFWPVTGVLVVLSLTLHFWYRYKTKGWTKSFGGWHYDKED